MAIFNEERAPARPFGGWEFASMVEAGGSLEETVWRAGCARRSPGPDGDRRPPCHDTPRANRKRIIFIFGVFQAGCDRPITWIPRSASHVLSCLLLKSPRRNAEPDRRFGVLQPRLTLELTPPVVPPQVYHRSTHQCYSDRRDPSLIKRQSFEHGCRGEGRPGERR